MSYAERVLAASPGQMRPLQRFWDSLDDKQKWWFCTGFPSAVQSWFQGGFDGARDNDNLPLVANTYKALDALAVGLLHIRSICPPKVPRVLHRTTILKKDSGEKESITIDGADLQKPLFSWSMNEEVFAGGGDIPKGYVMLHWKVDKPQRILASNASLEDFCHLATKFFDEQYNIARKAGEDTELIETGSMNWGDDVRRSLYRTSQEGECLVYLPRGQRMQCTLTRSPLE